MKVIFNLHLPRSHLLRTTTCDMWVLLKRSQCHLTLLVFKFFQILHAWLNTFIRKYYWTNYAIRRCLNYNCNFLVAVQCNVALCRIQDPNINFTVSGNRYISWCNYVHLIIYLQWLNQANETITAGRPQQRRWGLSLLVAT